MPRLPTEDDLKGEGFEEFAPGKWRKKPPTSDDQTAMSISSTSVALAPPPQRSLSRIAKSNKQRGRETTSLEFRLYFWLKIEAIEERVTAVKYQPAPLRLAYRCTYRPDATCIRNGRREYYEAKGRGLKRVYEDGWVKLKIAAEMFKDQADFYLFDEGNGGGLWLWLIPTRDAKPTKRKKLL